jgi:hypothetical protein
MGEWDQNGGDGVRDEENVGNGIGYGTEKEKLDAGALFVLQSKGLLQDYYSPLSFIFIIIINSFHVNFGTCLFF